MLAGIFAEPGCKRREPVRLQETDEAAPVLLSTVHTADPKSAIQLLKGFHAVEQNAWRWTMSKFAVTLKTPPGANQKGGTVVMKLVVPDSVLSTAKSTTLSAAIGPTPIGSATYNKPGEQTFTADVPASLLGTEAVTVDFALSHFLPPSSVDQRELGVIASSISLDPK